MTRVITCLTGSWRVMRDQLSRRLSPDGVSLSQATDGDQEEQTPDQECETKSRRENLSQKSLK